MSNAELTKEEFQELENAAALDDDTLVKKCL